MEAIRNKISESGLVNLDLSAMIPVVDYAVMDISPWLYEGLLLKEKDFREAVESNDWNNYAGKYVALICSTDAIVPFWAWMLISVKLQPIAARVFVGKLDQLKEQLLLEQLNTTDTTQYADARIVIKGCGHAAVTPAVYATVTSKLAPVAKSIMYGEPCSTVPIMKRK